MQRHYRNLWDDNPPRQSDVQKNRGQDSGYNTLSYDERSRAPTESSQTQNPFDLLNQALQMVTNPGASQGPPPVFDTAAEKDKGFTWICKKCGTINNEGNRSCIVCLTPWEVPPKAKAENKIDDLDSKKLYISNLSRGTTTSDLFRYFSKWGPMDQVYVAMTERGASKQYGFVQYINAKDAEQCSTANHVIDQTRVLVKFASSSNKAPESKHLMVTGLTARTTNDLLLCYFSRWGKIEDYEVEKDTTGRKTGKGFVKFGSVKEANTAASFEPHIIDGKLVSVTFQDPRHTKMREAQPTPSNPPSEVIPGLSLTSSSEDPEIPETQQSCRVHGCYFKGERSSFDRHWLERHEPSVKYIVCSFCTMGCVDIDDYAEHLNFFHGVEKNEMSRHLFNLEYEERNNTQYIMPGDVTRLTCFKSDREKPKSQSKQFEQTEQVKWPMRTEEMERTARTEQPKQRELPELGKQMTEKRMEPVVVVEPETQRCTEHGCTFRGTTTEFLQHWNKEHVAELVYLRCPMCPKTFKKKASLDFHVEHVHQNHNPDADVEENDDDEYTPAAKMMLTNQREQVNTTNTNQKYDPMFPTPPNEHMVRSVQNDNYRKRSHSTVESTYPLVSGMGTVNTQTSSSLPYHLASQQMPGAANIQSLTTGMPLASTGLPLVSYPVQVQPAYTGFQQTAPSQVVGGMTPSIPVSTQASQQSVPLQTRILQQTLQRQQAVAEQKALATKNNLQQLEKETSKGLLKFLRNSGTIAERHEWPKEMSLPTMKKIREMRSSEKTTPMFQVPSIVIPPFKRNNAESIKAFLLWNEAMLGRLESANLKARKLLISQIVKVKSSDLEEVSVEEDTNVQNAALIERKKEAAKLADLMAYEMNQNKSVIEKHTESKSSDPFEDFKKKCHDLADELVRNHIKSMKKRWLPLSHPDQPKNHKGKPIADKEDAAAYGKLTAKAIGKAKYMVLNLRGDTAMVGRAMSLTRQRMVYLRYNGFEGENYDTKREKAGASKETQEGPIRDTELRVDKTGEESSDNEDVTKTGEKKGEPKMTVFSEKIRRATLDLVDSLVRYEINVHGHKWIPFTHPKYPKSKSGKPLVTGPDVTVFRKLQSKSNKKIRQMVINMKGDGAMVIRAHKWGKKRLQHLRHFGFEGERFDEEEETVPVKTAVTAPTTAEVSETVTVTAEESSPPTVSTVKSTVAVDPQASPISEEELTFENVEPDNVDHLDVHDQDEVRSNDSRKQKSVDRSWGQGVDSRPWQNERRNQRYGKFRDNRETSQHIRDKGRQSVERVESSVGPSGRRNEDRSFDNRPKKNMGFDNVNQRDGRRQYYNDMNERQRERGKHFDRDQSGTDDAEMFSEGGVFGLRDDLDRERRERDHLDAEMLGHARFGQMDQETERYQDEDFYDVRHDHHGDRDSRASYTRSERHEEERFASEGSERIVEVIHDDIQDFKEDPPRPSERVVQFVRYNDEEPFGNFEDDHSLRTSIDQPHGRFTDMKRQSRGDRHGVLNQSRRGHHDNRGFNQNRDYSQQRHGFGQRGRKDFTRATFQDHGRSSDGQQRKEFDKPSRGFGHQNRMMVNRARNDYQRGGKRNFSYRQESADQVSTSWSQDIERSQKKQKKQETGVPKSWSESIEEMVAKEREKSDRAMSSQQKGKSQRGGLSATEIKSDEGSGASCSDFEDDVDMDDLVVMDCC